MAKVGQIGLSDLNLAVRQASGDIDPLKKLKVAGMVSATVELDMLSENIYCDDVVADVVNGFSSGTVTLELLGLSMDEYAFLTGLTITKGGIVDNVNTVVPNFSMTFRSKKSNGKYRYVCIPQAKPNILGETFNTQEDGVEIANVEVEFSIIPLDNGVWRVRADEDASNADEPFISGFLEAHPKEIA